MQLLLTEYLSDRYLTNKPILIVLVVLVYFIQADPHIVKT